MTGGSFWSSLLVGRAPVKNEAQQDLAARNDEAMVSLLLPAIYAALTTTPRAFVPLATALAPASQHQIRAGLLELQASGLAELEYGAGWYRPATNIEKLAASEPCETSTSYLCPETGRTPTARYSADRYCTPCLIRHYLEADQDDLANAGFGR